MKAYALVAELLLSIPSSPKRRIDDSSSEEYYATVPQLCADTGCLARARVEAAKSAPPISDIREIKVGKGGLLSDPSMGDPLNLGDATGIQTRGAKAKKAAAKKAAQARWAESDNEDGAKNGDGENDGGGGGGGDGAGGGGAGGNGDGGGGGDEGDDWDTGGKRSKKNKKKAKQEEEEKKAQEEEEAKKKEEEQAAATNNLSWANEPNDANVDDEWAAFMGKKDKKKKGKKVSLDAFTNLVRKLISYVYRASKKLPPLRQTLRLQLFMKSVSTTALRTWISTSVQQTPRRAPALVGSGHGATLGILDLLALALLVRRRTTK